MELTTGHCTGICLTLWGPSPFRLLRLSHAAWWKHIEDAHSATFQFFLQQKNAWRESSVTEKMPAPHSDQAWGLCVTWRKVSSHLLTLDMSAVECSSRPPRDHQPGHCLCYNCISVGYYSLWFYLSRGEKTPLWLKPSLRSLLQQAKKEKHCESGWAWHRSHLSHFLNIFFAWEKLTGIR